MVQQNEMSVQKESDRSNSSRQDVAILITSHNLLLTGKKSLACLSVAAEFIFFVCVFCF